MDRNYDILGISETASVDDIKKAYKKLAFQYHPDRNPGNNEQVRRFREITEAYKTISSQFGKKMGRPLLDLGIRYHGRIISVNMGLGGLDIEETKVRDVIQQCLSDLTESQGYRFDFRR